MSPETLDVIKVTMRGSTTSFRYPHFVQGVQPTYEMPPPSTIYGHICATIGRFEPPESLRFGLHFTYEAKVMDLEQVQIDSFREGSKTQREFTMNVFKRELLFNPILTLYLTPVHHIEAFRRPHYPVALGRSQDLMTYDYPVEAVTLHRKAQAYFEHTLLPTSYAPRFRRTVAVTMARYIDQQRQAEWESYAMLKERALYPEEDDPFRADYAPEWVDPTAPLIDDVARGVVLHSFRAS